MSQTSQLDEIRVLLMKCNQFEYNESKSLIENLKHALSTIGSTPTSPSFTDAGSEVQ
jgi:hypothetical protein